MKLGIRTTCFIGGCSKGALSMLITSKDFTHILLWKHKNELTNNLYENSLKGRFVA
jgi:hypothetical protein